MDQPPTRAEFDQLAGRVTRNEQRTEEIKAIRVEVASADVLNQLKALEEGQQELKRILLDQTIKKLEDVQETANIVKIQMEGARADILRIGESQADFRDKLKDHGESLKAIEENQDGHTETLGSLISSAESQEALLKNTATKDDIASMATKDDITRLEGLILQLLQQKPPES